MTRSWRLILDGLRPAAENMALDEALLRLARPETGVVRFYGWAPSAVSIGYFQGLEEEVNVRACAKMGVDVVRRITGGGAVYHDTDGELTYSLAAREDAGVIPSDVMDSYALICGGLVKGLARLGVRSRFSPINDLVADDGRKISGNAQTRRFHGVLQHGTILLDVDPGRMFSVLRVPSEKMRDKMIRAVGERVTSLRSILGSLPDRDRVAEALADGLGEALGVAWVRSGFTPEEVELARTVRAERYGSEAWTQRR